MLISPIDLRRDLDSYLVSWLPAGRYSDCDPTHHFRVCSADWKILISTLNIKVITHFALCRFWRNLVQFENFLGNKQVA